MSHTSDDNGIQFTYFLATPNKGDLEEEEDEDEPSYLIGLLQRSSKDLFLTGELSSSAGMEEALVDFVYHKLGGSKVSRTVN